MRFDRIDRDLLALFGLIALITFGAASALSHGILGWGHIVSSYLLVGFVGASVGIVPRCVSSIFAARRAGNSPVRGLCKSLADLQFWAWLAVPALIAPIFMASFTVTKILIGIELGFTWDADFADLDAAIFGADPWRYTHAVFGTRLGSKFLEFWYVSWGIVLAFLPSLVIAFSAREHAAKFLLAMFLTWAIAGLCLAAAFASAGPCFAGAFDPALKDRFAPLLDRLAALLSEHDPTRLSQYYLARYWNAKVAAQGGGISAFPSVHVAVAVLYVIASWRRPMLRYPALLFATMIWIGSVHFGYHYAVDGIASVAIACGVWVVAGRAVEFILSRHRPAVALAPAMTQSSA